MEGKSIKEIDEIMKEMVTVDIDLPAVPRWVVLDALFPNVDLAKIYLSKKDYKVLKKATSKKPPAKA